MAAPLSLRGYAKRRGCSLHAVQVAIRAGRLARSLVTVNGRSQIADADLADREWAANTDQTRQPVAAAAVRRTAVVHGPDSDAPIAPNDMIVSVDEDLVFVMDDRFPTLPGGDYNGPLFLMTPETAEWLAKELRAAAARARTNERERQTR